MDPGKVDELETAVESVKATPTMLASFLWAGSLLNA